MPNIMDLKFTLEDVDKIEDKDEQIIILKFILKQRKQYEYQINR